jgi:hypothetical protein
MSFDATIVGVTMQAAGPPTLTELCGWQATSLTLIEELDGPGMCTTSTLVDTIEPSAKARLIDLAAAPCELWVRKTVGDTAVVHSGPITGWQIVGKTITLTSPGLLTHLGYAIRDTDYTANSIDQATIVRTLIDDWQALPYANRGLYTTTGLTPTGVTRDLTLSARDGTPILPTILTMGGRTNGFDLTADPATRQVTIWSPRRGNNLTANTILDARSIGSPQINVTVAPGTIGSEVFASSSSTTGVTLTTTRSDTDRRQLFGRAYLTTSYQDISLQATLDGHADRTLIDSSTQVATLSPELLPVAGFAHGDIHPGDLITYDYDAGLGQMTFTARLSTVELSLDSGREMLRVGIV